MIIPSIVLIGIAVLLIFLIVIVYVMYKKLELYENIVDDIQRNNTELVDFVQDINQRCFNDLLQLKEIDKRGSFASDDEVGFVFKTMYKMVEDTYTFTKQALKYEEVEKEE